VVNTNDETSGIRQLLVPSLSCRRSGIAWASVGSAAGGGGAGSAIAAGATATGSGAVRQALAQFGQFPLLPLHFGAQRSQPLFVLGGRRRSRRRHDARLDRLLQGSHTRRHVRFHRALDGGAKLGRLPLLRGLLPGHRDRYALAKIRHRLAVLVAHVREPLLGGIHNALVLLPQGVGLSVDGFLAGDRFGCTAGHLAQIALQRRA
jgi:hypothetical protein